MKNIVAIIPARMAATRFPGKPMAKIHSIPMIGHCYMRTALTKGLTSTYVATCDREIFDYVKSIGGNAVMTSVKHERAVDRSAEAAELIAREMGAALDIVAVVQGDEPLVSPNMIELGIAPLLADPDLKVTNLMAPIASTDLLDNENEVKVVCDLKQNAMYFSREPIPSRRKWQGVMPLFKQLGLIYFRADFLRQFSAMMPTILEKIESVDMNRALEHGERIRMVSVDCITVGVDTPADLVRAHKLLEHDPLLPKYAHIAERNSRG